MTLKKLIYDILLVDQGCRNSDKKLLWKVWDYLGLVDINYKSISWDNFMKTPSNESIRRCRQALQRTDLLSGIKLIQPSEEIKKERIRQSKEKGFKYQEGKAVYNPVTNCYEI